MLRAHGVALPSNTPKPALGSRCRVAPRASVCPRIPSSLPVRSFHHRGRGCHRRQQASAAPKGSQDAIHNLFHDWKWNDMVKAAHHASSTLAQAVRDPAAQMPPKPNWSKHYSLMCPHGAQKLAHIVKRCMSSASEIAAAYNMGEAQRDSWRQEHMDRTGWNRPSSTANLGCFGNPSSWQKTSTPPTPPPPASSQSPPSSNKSTHGPQAQTQQTTTHCPLSKFVRNFAYYTIVLPFKAVLLTALFVTYGLSALFLVLCVVFLLWCLAYGKPDSKSKPKSAPPAPAPAVTKATAASSAVAAKATSTSVAKSVSSTNNASTAKPVSPAPAPAPAAPAAPHPAPRIAEQEAVVRAAEALARVARSLGL